MRLNPRRPRDSQASCRAGYLMPFSSELARIANHMPPEPLKPRRRRGQKIPGLSRTRPSSRFSDDDVMCALLLRELGCRSKAIAAAFGCSTTTIEAWASGITRAAVQP